MEGGLNEGLKVRPPGMEPFESNVTISKDNTDISAEQNLLFVKRADMDRTTYLERGDGDDVQDSDDQDDSDEDEDDQSETGDDSSNSGSEDNDRDTQNDGSSESPRGEDVDDQGADPELRGIDNAVSQDAHQDAVKVPADKLLAQIREKLSSIPGLGMSNDSPHNELIEYLTASMAKLSAENGMLKKALQAAKERPVADGPMPVAQIPAPENTTEQELTPDEPEEPVFHEVHLVRCYPQKNTYFQDVPRMFKGDLKSDHLRGRHGLENMATYLKKRKQVAFVVVHNYQCSCSGGTDYHRVVGYKDGRLIDDSPPAEAGTKHIVCNMNTRKAMTEISKAHPDAFEGWNVKRLPRYSYEPHYIYYVHHKTFSDLADSSNLNDFDARAIKLVCNWVAENSKEDWDEADDMFKRGKVAAQHYSKLFRPGELIVRQQTDRPGITWVYKVDSYPWATPDCDEVGTCHRWSFNGHYYKIQANLNFSFMYSQSQTEISPDDGEVDITSLNLYPLRFAKPELYNSLLARGNRFWSCRKKKIVAYHDPDQDGEDGSRGLAEHRFMVDYNIFKRMHPHNSLFSTETDDLGSEAMAKNEPPDDQFLALLPPEIHAFDLAAKTWKLLRVDRITDVTWNKDAFKRLVLPKENKELIQAAVMAQGRLLGASPDIIAGKGQGLLILLHGGPGTGKTLTAESIAETQERPLYRVTCGDIGIEPAYVERYLESVFTIGKAWGCVVLLDEADVFLEERNPTDQKQNAIVSVFLRLLEYYDGILILTTNRVGTFDEAFKSRIHLALRYENLKEDQRVEIWRNLLSMLKSRDDERIDINDLLINVNKVAREDLNGRQIRNVITLARYLAKFRAEMMVYRHVQDALASVVKFDQYLLGLRGHDDTWAAEQRLR